MELFTGTNKMLGKVACYRHYEIKDINMNKDSLGDRMKKNYENISRNKLYRRTPVIIRLDGKSFHTLTKGGMKPFDMRFMDIMASSTLKLFDLIGGNLKFAYIQSDEVSLLLTDWEKHTTEAYFDYNIQKLCSVVASTMSVNFSGDWPNYGVFDARCFNIPKEEVCNYFIWRQQDWIRNSIQMLAQTYFNPRELHGKKHGEVNEMLVKENVPWTGLSKRLKNGTVLYRDTTTDKNEVELDDNIPNFTKDRHYVERLL